MVRFVAAAGALLLPVAWTRWFFPRTNRAVAIFFTVQTLCALVTIFCMVWDNALKTSFRELISFLPLSTLILSLADSGADTAGRMSAVSFTTLTSLVMLLAALRHPMRQARLAERAGLQLPPPPDALLV